MAESGSSGENSPSPTAVQLFRPDHIVVVVEENHGYSGIIGNPDAPFINSLAQQGELFTNYSAIAHPSEPNYMALFSGSTQGITDDGTYSLSAPTLAGELAAAGDSFTGYAEGGSPQKHNPWQSFADSQGTGKDFSQFPADFSQLPTVAFVSPNLTDDMHDGTVAQGDAWLRNNLGAYVAWARTHNSLLLLTFDEDDGTGGNQVATIAVGANITAGENGDPANHYSLLRSIEDIYGLPALGQAANASPLDLTVSSQGSGAMQFASAPAMEVSLLYQTAFDRLPDQTGLAYWVGQLANSDTLAEEAAAFAGSPEFLLEYGQADNATLVTELYRNALGRAPDAPGFAFWTNALSSGMSRGDVLLGFAESPENIHLHGPGLVVDGFVQP